MFFAVLFKTICARTSLLLFSVKFQTLPGNLHLSGENTEPFVIAGSELNCFLSHWDSTLICLISYFDLFVMKKKSEDNEHLVVNYA